MNIFYNKMFDIHTVQGLGGINEMIAYIAKMYASIKAYAVYFSGVKFTL